MSDEKLPAAQAKEIIEEAKKLPPMERFSLRPRNFEEAYRFANLIADSDLIPKEFQKKPANVLLAVQLGMELGVSPMQALQSIYVVNGRPAIFGDLLPAIIFNSGFLEAIHEEGDEQQASCTVKRKGHVAITRTFTMKDAERAKTVVWIGNERKFISLAEKETYKSYPKRMLQMRARALALRDMFPDVLKGVAIREEIEDEIEPVDITPVKPEPLKIPKPLEAKDEKADSQREPVAGTDNVRKVESEAGADQKVAEVSPPSNDPNGDYGSKEIGGNPTPDRKAEALAYIASFTKENFPEAKTLNPYLKGLSGQAQSEIILAFQAKKKELGIG